MSCPIEIKQDGRKSWCLADGADAFLHWTAWKRRLNINAKLYSKWDKKIRAPAKTTCQSRWSTARNYQEALLIFNICSEVCWEGCGSHHSVQWSDSLTGSVQRDEDRTFQIYWLAFNALFNHTLLPFIYFIQSSGYHFLAHISVFFSVEHEHLLNEFGTDTEQILVLLYERIRLCEH